MIILGIDQSIGKTAFVVYDSSTDTVILKTLPKTGGMAAKGKKFDTISYFHTKEERIHYICAKLTDVVHEYKPDAICFESLAFGASGNATRDLAELMGAMTETLMTTCSYPVGKIYKVTPTTVKAFARNFLPDNEKFDGVTKAGKQKLKKMEKPDMVRAALHRFGSDYLNGLKSSGANSGADDIADASFIALLGYELLTKELSRLSND